MQLLGAQLGTNNSNALAKYSQMLQTLDGLLGPVARTARQYSGFARVDWHMAERRHFTAEWLEASRSWQLSQRTSLHNAHVRIDASCGQFDKQDIHYRPGPSMNGSGADNRVYGMGNNGIAYDMGRNTFRYPNAWKADVRIEKQINFGKMRQLELLGETFNLFNHRNVTEVETIGYSVSSGNLNGTFPSLTYFTGLKANYTAFGEHLNSNSTSY